MDWKYTKGKLFNEFSDFVGDGTNFVDIMAKAELVEYRIPGAVVLFTSFISFALSAGTCLPRLDRMRSKRGRLSLRMSLANSLVPFQQRRHTKI